MTDARLTVVPDDAGIAVARRVVRAVAATTLLPVDRLEDAVLVCDIVLGAIRDSPHATITFHPEAAGVELTFELQAFQAKRVHYPEPDGLAALVTRLSNRVWTEGDGEHDVRLHVLVGSS